MSLHVYRRYYVWVSRDESLRERVREREILSLSREQRLTKTMRIYTMNVLTFAVMDASFLDVFKWIDYNLFLLQFFD